jgi:hypothetical protein
VDRKYIPKFCTQESGLFQESSHYQLGDQREMKNIWGHEEIICVSEHME